MPKNITGAPVTGDNLYGRSYELQTLWELLDNGANILMLAPRRVGKTSLMLQLCEAPNADWTVFYIDLEAGNSPADLVTEMLACLATHPKFKAWLDHIPFREGVSKLLSRISTSYQYEGLKVELRQEIAGDWKDQAAQLEDRLTNVGSSDGRVLFILDELPILMAHILGTSDGPRQAEELMTWFRALRQNPRLKRVQFLSAGSIGLEGVLRRHSLSGYINDLVAFRVEPWDEATARSFLKDVGVAMLFPIAPELIDVMLRLLSQYVPYHIQLFYNELRSQCRGDQSGLSIDLVESTFQEKLAGPGGTAHLDHYANRLETIFTLEELPIAREVLKRASRSKDGFDISSVVQSANYNPDLFRNVTRVLCEDGYLQQSDSVFQFPSNFLRVWWDKTQARWERS